MVEITATLILLGPARLPPAMVIFFGVLAIDMVFVITFAYGFAGDLNKQSKIFVATLQSTKMFVARRSRKCLSLFIQSCPPLKIRFGMSNYIDKTTPLIFQSFCSCRIVDLLLVKK